MKRRTQWQSRTVFVNQLPVTIFTDPKGVEWVRAHTRAHAERVMKCSMGLPPVEMRRFVGSSVERALRQRIAKSLRLR
jgi:hypothetical protein